MGRPDRHRLGRAAGFGLLGHEPPALGHLAPGTIPPRHPADARAAAVHGDLSGREIGRARFTAAGRTDRAGYFRRGGRVGFARRRGAAAPLPRGPRARFGSAASGQRGRHARRFPAQSFQPENRDGRLLRHRSRSGAGPAGTGRHRRNKPPFLPRSIPRRWRRNWSAFCAGPLNLPPSARFSTNRAAGAKCG